MEVKKNKATQAKRGQSDTDKLYPMSTCLFFPSGTLHNLSLPVWKAQSYEQPKVPGKQ